jgi:hypothetical protein
MFCAKRDEHDDFSSEQQKIRFNSIKNASIMHLLKCGEEGGMDWGKIGILQKVL